RRGVERGAHGGRDTAVRPGPRGPGRGVGAVPDERRSGRRSGGLTSVRIQSAVARRARVLGACATVALFGAAGPVGVAAAAPPVPQTQCSLADPALAEVSGLVADGERWYVVNDGGSDLRVYVLARDCTLLDVIVDDAD